MLTCAACGRENSDDARFCSGCGTPLAASAAPAREERKVVTVLFCDLVGFTQRSEAMDPEDVRALLRSYHEHLRAELERFGGTVEKFIGDAVVAVFGAPQAHEDDPERAVRAALAIRDWAQEQEGLELRIAVNTGEALVTLEAQPGEGMVAGDVVNTAARLQSAAPTNGTLVGETTFRATRDRIDYREHEPVAAKGKAEPVAVWEALEARAPVETDRRAHAPLVGRDRELRLLTELLDRVRDERSSQLVTLVGAPGIGKSRLVYELFAHVEQHSDPVTWRQGRSLPYGEGGSYWGLAEIVKAEVGVLESDSAAEARQKLHDAVVEGAGGDPWVEGHLAALLGIAADEKLQTERDDAFAAWLRFFEGLAEQRPLILVFDDLQWAEEGLLEFVDHLVDWASGVPILVVVTARPELLERRPGWGGGKLNATTLALSPLTDTDAARLLGTLLERVLIEAETQSALLARIGGNPLYAEQYALLYGERESTSDLPPPESVQGIIAARLDLLAHEEKQVLQDAAVVGKAFWPGALGRDRGSVARTLHALERKDFVRRERRSSVEGEDEYAFRHLLVRDVAYGQLPRAARAERHRATAAWIESLGCDRDDHAELLAEHHVRALELARAVNNVQSDDERRAREALLRAGEHAMRLAAFDRAARAFEQAVALSADAERPRALLAYGKALHRLEDERGEHVLSEARDLFSARDDVERAGEAEATLTELHWQRRDGIRAAAHAERAVELLRGSRPSFAKAYALSNLARIQTFAGRLDEARATAEEAVEIANDLDDNEIRAHALDTLGTAKATAGDTAGIADLERAVELALAANSIEAARAYNNLGGSLLSIGDTARGQQMWDEGVRVAERFGNRRWAEQMADRSGVLFTEGEWDDALRHALDAADTERAFILFARGQLEAAEAESDRCVEDARRSGRADELGLALAVRLLVGLARGDADAAAVLDELVALAPAFAPWMGVFEGVAIALADGGRPDAVLEALEGAPRTPGTEAVELYARGEFGRAATALADVGNHVFEAHARLRAAEQLVTQGRRVEADRELDEALAFWRKAGATYYVRQAEQLMSATA